MGIFSKLFGDEEATFIEGVGDFDQEIVGESHYQKHHSLYLERGLYLLQMRN